MRVRLIAVGTRLPAWVRGACEDYLARLTSRLAISLVEIEPGPRSAGGTAHNAIAAEGQRLLGAVRPGDHVAVLDERGTQLSTRELAAWLQERMQQGEDLAFLIGGPQVLARGNFTLSLSRLTLPHALVRVLLAEQLYRAHSILTHHPYHRD